MNIIELAEKAGMTRRPADWQCRAPYWDVVIDSELERFAALVLEEAAKVCDGVYYQNIGPDHGEVRYGIAACSVSIREKALALKGAKE